MMMNNPRVLIWFVAQFTVAVYGAVGALADAKTGVLAATAAAAAASVTAALGWAARRREHANKTLSELLAGLGLAGFLYLLFTQDLLFALGVLLFFAQLALNVTLREYRQVYLGLVVGFIFVMVGASESVSGYYLLVLILYTLSASYCLAEAWLDKGSEVVGSLPSPSAWQRLRVTGNIVLLALLVYLVMPRPPAALLGAQQANSPQLYQNRSWEQQAETPPEQQDNTFDDPQQQSPPRTDAHQNGEDASQNTRNRREANEPAYDYSGFEEQFNIDEAGNRDPQQGNGIVAYMQAPHGSYLKVRVFDRFDGERWSRSRDDYIIKKLERGKITLQPALEPNFQQVIDIRQTLPARIPAAPRIVSLNLPSTVLALDAWQRPLLPDSLKAQTRYTVNSHMRFERGRLVSGGPAPRPDDLQVPQPQDPRITRLADRVTAHTEDDLDKAQALERHLRTQYQYSYRSIFESQGVTPLGTFLFEEKAGHCEYFASAMAIMLRTQDIPARLVTGFSATRKNPLTGYYEIRALDGHAWVEAWIEGHGWLVFEPTAAYNLPRPEAQPLSAEQINEYVESLNQSNETLGQENISIERVLIGLWQSLYHLTVVVLSYLKLFFSLALPYLIGLAGLAAVLYFTRGLWRPPLTVAWCRWRIRRYTPKQPRKALRFYLYYLQKMADCRRTQRRPSETVEQWGAKLARRFRCAPPAELSAMVNAAFYENEDVDLHALKHVVQRTADAIRRR